MVSYTCHNIAYFLNGKNTTKNMDTKKFALTKWHCLKPSQDYWHQTCTHIYYSKYGLYILGSKPPTALCMHYYKAVSKCAKIQQLIL